MDKTINLNALRDKAYKTACEHGFHATELSDEHCLCLVISELMEAVDADRKGRRADVAKFKEWMLSSNPHEHVFENAFNEHIKDTISDELSDAVIRLLDLAGLRNIKINDFTEDEINDFADARTDEIFTESIYNISMIPCRFEQHLAAPLSESIPFMITAIFGLAAHLKIDIMWHIEHKMKYNKLRDKMHGKKY